MIFLWNITDISLIFLRGPGVGDHWLRGFLLTQFHLEQEHPMLISCIHVFPFFCVQQKIAIPRSENSSELQTFTFYLSNVGRDNPQGSFDCIQQYITRWRQKNMQLILLFRITNSLPETNLTVFNLCLNNEQTIDR